MTYLENEEINPKFQSKGIGEAFFSIQYQGHFLYTSIQTMESTRAVF